jgi:hypothetical protein
MSKILAAGAIALLMSGYASANNWETNGFESQAKKQKKSVAAPEMDSTSAGAALVLLGGGLIVLFGRKTVKKD